MKSRNAEKKLAIDEQLLPHSVTESVTPETQSSLEDSTVTGPSTQEIPLAVHLKLLKKQQSDESSHEGSNNNADEDDDKEGDAAASSGPATGSPPSHFSASHNIVEAKAVSARIEPSSEWLIYRQRTNLTPRRRDQRVEEMIQRVLQPPGTSSSVKKHKYPETTLATSSAKGNETLPPSRPRQPSLSGTTYHQRVAATRQKNSPRVLHPLGELVPLTETERTLLSSREETNRDVDRLLVTLFQQQQQSSGAPGISPELSKTLAMKPSAVRFSTRRSEFREQTSAALKSRNLVSRMDELRSLPQVLEQMVQRHRDKQQQLVLSHGENLILKNKRQSCLNLLQRPPQTPVFPSSIEQKQQQAIRRKQVFDAREEAAVRGAVNRWQTRRQQRQEEARRTYRQCQWLLLTTLAQTSVSWLGKFQDWKLKRDALHQVVMARRIQAFWRKRALIRSNSLSGFGYFSSASLNSPFYRMPIVMKSVSLLQKAMRKWLKRKKNRHSVAAVEIIVTSWLEFQDVKFRRLILRFRKRVRDFQIMWRTWRAITDARIKLLLHVWTKLERKSKRRHGVLNSNNSRPLGIPDGGSALVHSLKAATLSPEKHQKQIEGMHRHLKNGGTVQTPLSIANAAAASSPAKSPSIATIARVLSPGFSASLQGPKTSSRVKQDLEFRHQIGEDFQHAMQDFYAANNNIHHQHGELGSAHLYSPSYPMMMVPYSSSPRAAHTRGKGPSSSSPSPPSWKTLADAVSPGAPPHAEKVPLHLKVSMLRHMLSEKRKAFQANKDRKRYETRLPMDQWCPLCAYPCLVLAASRREEWKSRRQQMRRIEFRYNVLEELVAYQRFQMENSVFLLLHSVSESEMLHLMHRAQQAANAAVAVAKNQEQPGSGFYAGAHLLDDPAKAHAPSSQANTVASCGVEQHQKASALERRSLRRSTVGHQHHHLPMKPRSIVSVSVVELLEDDDE